MTVLSKILSILYAESFILFSINVVYGLECFIIIFRNPLAQMEEEKREHDLKMKNMESEMEKVTNTFWLLICHYTDYKGRRDGYKYFITVFHIEFLPIVP